MLRLLEVKVWALGDWNCSVHCREGVCVDAGARCECSADWVGPQCDTFLRTDSRFLPATVWGGRSWWDADAARHAGKALLASQYPASCRSAHVDYYSFHNVGLGGTLTYISGLLSLSFARGRAMVVVAGGSRGQEWVYAPRNCSAGGFECVFASWTPCALDSAGGVGKGGGSHGEGAGGGGEMSVFSMPHTIVEHFDWIPPRFRRRGFYFWRAMTAQYLFRLSEDFLPTLRVEETLDALGWHLGLSLSLSRTHTPSPSLPLSLAPCACECLIRPFTMFECLLKPLPSFYSTLGRRPGHWHAHMSHHHTHMSHHHTHMSHHHTHHSAGDRVIGMHVRHGDSCKTNIRRNKCVPVERHLAEVRA